MDELNYHHLRYFHAVATEGSVAAAAECLYVAQPTISGQIKSLERSLGEQLFERKGRNLELTEVGHLVYGYAEEIFDTGRELVDAISGHSSGRPHRLRTAAEMSVPKLVVFELLKPAMDLDEQVELVCEEGRMSDLLAKLAVHQLDVVFSETPMGPEYNVRAFNHLLGQSTLSLFAPNALARRLRAQFPERLNDCPLLMPLAGTALRRQIDTWLESHELRPRTVGEFADSALIKVFGQNGSGAFFAPTAIADSIVDQFGCQIVAEIPDISQNYYAITVERRIKHPAIAAISEAARKDLFG